MDFNAYTNSVEDAELAQLQELTLEGLSYKERQRFYDYLIAQHVHFELDSIRGKCYMGRWRVRELPAPIPSPTPAMRKHMAQRTPNTIKTTAEVAQGKKYIRTRNFILERYKEYCQYIGNVEDLRARRHTVPWLLATIQEIYDVRYGYDEHYELKRAEYEAQAQRASRRGEEMPPFEDIMSLPAFINDYFGNKYGLPKLIRQNLWDLVYNVEMLRQEFLEISVFGEFLDGTFNTGELQFFLHARERLANRVQRGGQSPELTALHMIRVKRLPALLESIFGDSPKLFEEKYMEMVERYLSQRPAHQRESLELHEAMYLALHLWHKTRPGQSNRDLKYTRDDEDAANAARAANDSADTRAPDRSTTRPATASKRGGDANPARPGTPGGSSRPGSRAALTQSPRQSPRSSTANLREPALKRAGSGSNLSGSNPDGPLRPGASRMSRQNSAADSPSGGDRPGSRQVSRNASRGGPVANLVSEEGGQRSPAGSSASAADLVDANVPDQLITLMREVMLSYLDVVMTAANNLPVHVYEEIRRYVEDKLHDKVAALLSETVQRASEDGGASAPEEPPTSAGSPEKHAHMLNAQRAQLARLYRSIRWPHDERTPPDDLIGFCQALMGSPDLRHDIEPLVAFMVTAATKKLDQEQADKKM